MTKQAQQLINNACVSAMERYNRYVEQGDQHTEERLDYCQAYILDFEDWQALRSYNTIVALYDKTRGTFYDVLRYAYGYTATSAKHISKFRNMHRSAEQFMYRDI